MSWFLSAKNGEMISLVDANRTREENKQNLKVKQSTELSFFSFFCNGMSMRHNFVKSNPDVFYFFKSRMVSRKSTVFFLIGFVTLFIFYQVLYFQQRIPPVVIPFHNRSAAIQPRVTNSYSYVYHDQLVPEYVQKIVDKAQSPSTCLMIVRDTDGGIGNRMFLFASAYGLARLHQCDLYVAPWIIRDLRSIFTLDLNNTPVHLITNDTVVNQTNLVQRYSACTLYTDLLKIPLNENLTKYELMGFYQAFGYFVKYKYEINYLFQFHRVPIERNVPLVEQLVKGK